MKPQKDVEKMWTMNTQWKKPNLKGSFLNPHRIACWRQQTGHHAWETERGVLVRLELACKLWLVHVVTNLFSSGVLAIGSLAHSFLCLFLARRGSYVWVHLQDHQTCKLT